MLAVAALIAVAPGSALAAADADSAMPTAEGYDAKGERMASYAPVLQDCAATRATCSFQIDQTKPREFNTAVQSLGNAVINCTKKDIKVTRKLTLTTATSDNLGGEIGGSADSSGNVSGSVSSSLENNNNTNGSFSFPNLETGPTGTIGGTTTTGASGSVTGSMGASAAFKGAYNGRYSRTWMDQQAEETQYDVVVAPGDTLVFAASHAMQRVTGTLTTGSGGSIRNVAVDGPSSVNRSTFIADTFTVPDGTCQRVRPEGRLAQEAAGPRAMPAADMLTPIDALPKGAQLKKRSVASASQVARIPARLSK
ncbi:hypothetical protein [Streptomyces sp. cg36]|uniref:hypothetical protein n=1 Tax=Streptomyces sp. cg36 TaxID=3238798 RepID=UPI0034E252E8